MMSLLDKSVLHLHPYFLWTTRTSKSMFTGQRGSIWGLSFNSKKSKSIDEGMTSGDALICCFSKFYRYLNRFLYHQGIEPRY